MKGPGIFAIVTTFLLFGHINSAVITTSEPITTATPEQTTQDTPAEPCCDCHHDDLQVDGSNPVMGDVPISQEHPVKIINRNRKSLQNIALKLLLMVYIFVLQMCPFVTARKY